MEYGFGVQRQCLLAAILVVVSIECNDWSGSPITDTNYGKVKGLRTAVHGTEMDVYYGIPYAKPPVGNLRFKNPVPIDPWRGVYDATKRPNACWQALDTLYGDHPGSQVWAPNTNRSEDCLYLNVWVPRSNFRTMNKKKPVMIWIFGGGFVSGSAVLDVYDAKYIATENDIIVVSMQYRLGSIGFMYLNNNEAPGNAGMFDQVMALGWVQNNIHFFGGDRNQVTLFGESAGGVSVGMHMLSPLTQRLFKRAIIESAGPQAGWAVLTDNQAINRSLRLAKLFKCDYEDNMEVVECLRNVPPEHFPMREYEVIEYGAIRFPFVPRVDGIFLTESPEKALQGGRYKKCELLLGHNTNEASYWMIYYDQNIFSIKHSNKLSRNMYDLLIDDLFHYHPYYPKELSDFGKEAIKFFYRNWLNPDNQTKNVWQIDMALGDFNFICPTIDLAQHYASTGNDVFYYVFDHRSSKHHWPKWMGVAHGDEINFVFGEPLDRSKGYSREERIFSKKIMKYWTNFAKTGNPNKSPGDIDINEWPVYDNKTRKHLILRADLINNLDKSKAIEEGSRVKECAFWKEYLPRLLTTTAPMSDMEVQWKLQFNDWSTKYIVEWKKQFDNFMVHHNTQLQSTSCGDKEP